MNGHIDGDVVRVGGDARQRFHDSRGYGYPTGGNGIALAHVEAAHLLYRGDLDAVDGMDFRAFVRDATGNRFLPQFLVYADLRERGFYVSPAREEWLQQVTAPESDLVVYPRGKGPGDGEVAYRVRVVGERQTIAAAALGDCVLAVVDEESEITYFETASPDPAGAADIELPTGVDADLLADRVVCWGPPAALYESGFYGTPLAGRDADHDALQLSLVEAAYLAERGAIALDAATVRERGQTVEGDRFGRRLRTYGALRERNVVPKTGFKFGADFRTYAEFEDIDEFGHSELLVRVLPAGHVFSPRDLSLDVRLANGVRKQMVFAVVDETGGRDGEGITWLRVGRLTP
ncbi:tRNA-intron lyase [Haloarchaeobius litoreus]|uniref:tRNA-splicing endonuclease n=1 Tax=Haloarchaeobius litoreus TaxID=755306 RepID=A0ABD6DJQ6_9EURY|nr:tRNA-intron lyase [Haloarchaeobius litoreus]